MIVLAEAFAELSTTGTPPVADAALSIYAVADEQARASLTVSANIVESILPRVGRRQFIAVEVWIDGVQVPHQQVLSVNVSEFLDQAATFQLSLLARGDWPSAVADPHGNPVTLKAPVPGIKNVTIIGYHVSSSGRYPFTVITNGVAHTSDRVGGTDIISGVDASGRLEVATADLHLPPGHGLDAGTVCARIATAAGWPSTAYAFRRDLGRMDKEVQLISDPALAAIFEIAGARGYAPVCDRAGVLRLVRWDLQGRTPSRQWTIGYRDFVSDEVSESGYVPPPQNIVTAIFADGTQQLTREECGVAFEPTVNEFKQIFAIPVYLFAQQSNGTLTPSGLTPGTPRLQLATRTTLLIERSCEEILVEETRVEEYYKIRAARYTIDAAGPINGTPDVKTYLPVVLFDSGAVANDNTAAYADNREFFRETKRQRVENIFDPVEFNPNLLDDLGISVSSPVGYKVGEIETEWGWINPRAAIKFRSGATNAAWDTIAYIDDQYVEDRREGVANSREQYVIVRRRTTGYTLIQIADAWYISAITHLIEELTARPGDDYLYNSGFTSLDGSETLVRTRVERELFTPIDDDGARHRWTRTVSAPYAADPKDRVTVERETREGFLPEAVRRTDIAPDPDLFDTPEEAEAAALASRFDHQRIECEVVATALEQNRPRHRISQTYPWAENIDDLCAQAARTLKEGSVGQQRLGLPINLSVRPGDQLTTTDDRNLLSSLLAYVDSVQWSWTGTALVTQITAKVYSLTDADITVTVSQEI